MPAPVFVAGHAAAFDTPVGAAEGADDLPRAVADTITDLLDRPRARGWIHFYSAATAIVAGAALVHIAWLTVSPKAGWATPIWGAGGGAMMGGATPMHSSSYGGAAG